MYQPDRLVYLDNASTTRIDKRVLDVMLPHLDHIYGNPSSIHSSGRNARKAIEDARCLIADTLGSSPREIIFTSSATEANNLAIFGIACALKSRGKHIITSSIEHPSVIHACQQLEKEDFDISYIPVDSCGVIKLDDLESLIRSDTILISVMFANNETGVIQPVEKVAEIAKKRSIRFHTDAVQVVGKLKFDFKTLGADLVSLSSHKIHGPKGAGALFVREGVNLRPMMYGGPQEFETRAGTENVACVVGLAKAVESAINNLEKNCEILSSLQENFECKVMTQIGGCWLNSHPQCRLPNISNISFDGLDGEAIIIALDSFNICASTGSACASLTLEPSHVLEAMSLGPKRVRGAVRFSFSIINTQDEIDYTFDVLKKVILRLRQIAGYENE